MTSAVVKRTDRIVVDWLRHGRTELTWREAGRGRPVLLLHCYPVDGRLFAAQLRAAARGRLGARLIIPDIPGFGRSPLPRVTPSRYTVEELALLIGFLINALNERPVIGGVAIGGSTAIAAAASGADVAGLVLVSNRLGGDLPHMAERRRSVIQRVLTEGSAKVAADLAAAPLGPHASPSVRRRVEAMIAQAAPQGIASLTQAIAERPDPRDMVGRIRVPALVIAGAEDPFCPPSEARQLADRLPGSIFHVVAGSGHMVPIERPRQVTSALAEFLRTLEA